MVRFLLITCGFLTLTAKLSSAQKIAFNKGSPTKGGKDIYDWGDEDGGVYDEDEELYHEPDESDEGEGFVEQKNIVPSKNAILPDINAKNSIVSPTKSKGSKSGQEVPSNDQRFDELFELVHNLQAENKELKAKLAVNEHKFADIEGSLYSLQPLFELKGYFSSNLNAKTNAMKGELTKLDQKITEQANLNLAEEMKDFVRKDELAKLQENAMNMDKIAKAFKPITICNKDNVNKYGKELGGSVKKCGRLDKVKLRSKKIKNLPFFWFEGMDNMQTLDLAKNEIASIYKNQFLDNTGLVKLSLWGNQIEELHVDTFHPLHVLTTLFLNDNKLTTLPEKLFEGNVALKTLLLQKNNLVTFPPNLFGEAGEDLVKLHLYGNQITELDENAFLGLTSLTDLQLNENKLKTIPENLFSDLSELQKLYLHENEIESLAEGTFYNNFNLKELYLYGNKLSSLPENVFSGNYDLTHLYLQRNQFKTFEPNTFSTLENLEILPIGSCELEDLDVELFRENKNLKLLYLNGNKLSKKNKKQFKKDKQYSKIKRFNV